MNLGTWRNLARLPRLAALALLVLTLEGWWRGTAPPAEPPEFRPPVFSSVRGPCGSRLYAIGMPLGRFARDEAVEEVPAAGPGPAESSSLGQLGRIASAIVAEPPYEEVQPAIAFELAAGGTRVLRLGDALVTRPHPLLGAIRPVAVRYRFLGVYREADGTVFFEFDVDCDGRRVELAKWERRFTTGGASVAFERASADRADAGLRMIARRGVFVGTSSADVPMREVRLEKSDRELLAERHEEISSGVVTRESKRGIEIVRLRGPARRFGVVAQDVLLSINGIAVRTKTQAERVVRAELRRGVEEFLVRVLRKGREIELSFRAP